MTRILHFVVAIAAATAHVSAAFGDDVMAVRTVAGRLGVGVVTFDDQRRCRLIVPRHVFCPTGGGACPTAAQAHSVYDAKGQSSPADATLDNPNSQIEILEPKVGSACGPPGGGFTTAEKVEDLLRRYPTGFLRVASDTGTRENVPVDIVSFDLRSVTVRPVQARDHLAEGMSGSPLIVGSDGAIVAILNDVCAAGACDAGSGRALRIDALRPEIERVLSLTGGSAADRLRLRRNTFVLKMNDEWALDASEVTIEVKEANPGKPAWIELIMRNYSGQRIDRSAFQICYDNRACKITMSDRTFSVTITGITTNAVELQVEEL